MSASQDDDDDDGKAWLLAPPRPPTLRIQPLETFEIISESEEEMRRFDEIDVGAAGP